MTTYQQRVLEMSVVCDRACRAQLLKFWSKVMYVVVRTWWTYEYSSTSEYNVLLNFWRKATGMQYTVHTYTLITDNVQNANQIGCDMY